MVKIFMVEDNPGDADLVREAFSYAGSPCEMLVAEDGQAAVSIMERWGIDLPCPDIVIVDINLPKLDGLELLRLKKLKEECAHVPVLVMSSSQSPFDLEMSTRMGATYFHKSMRLTEYFRVVDIINGLVSAASQLAASNIQPNVQ